MGKAKRFNSYDSDVSEKRKLVEAYGKTRQNLSIGSSFRSSALSVPIATPLTTSETSSNASYKLPVRIASTANLTLSGEQTIDGFLTSADRILVKDQSTGAENGIYVTGSSTWSRASDFTVGLVDVAGSLIPVEEGTANEDTVWIVTTDNPTTVDTTALVFADITTGSAGANTALSNLASVAINASLISDTDNTDDLGSLSLKWKDLFVSGNIRFGTDGTNETTEANIFVSSGGNLAFNVATGDSLFQLINGTEVTQTSVDEFEVRTVTLDGPILRLNNNDQTPTNGDKVAQIIFTGNDDNLANANYGIISIDMDDVGNTTKQGQFKVAVQKDNSLLSVFDYTGGDATLRISSAVDVMRPNQNGTKELGTSSFHWDDVFSETFTLRDSGGSTTDTTSRIYGDGTNRMIFNATGSGFKFTNANVTNFTLTTSSFSHSATVGGLASGTFQLNTTGATGAFYNMSFQHQNSLGSVVSYAGIQAFAEDIVTDTLDGRLEFSIASNSLNSTASNSLPVALSLISTGGVITANFENHDITNTGSITPNDSGPDTIGTAILFFDDMYSETYTLRGSGGNTTGSDRTIYGTADDMVLNMPTGDGFSLSINNSEEYNFDATLFTIGEANNIVLGTTTGTKIGTGTTQKIGFWNVTPVVQPSHIVDATDAASVITQLNLLLADMATLGLQAAS